MFLLFLKAKNMHLWTSILILWYSSKIQMIQCGNLMCNNVVVLSKQSQCYYDSALDVFSCVANTLLMTFVHCIVHVWSKQTNK